MTEINLLPWREALREAQKKQFITAIASVGVCALIVVLLVHIYFSHKIDTQMNRNNLLTTEIKRYDSQIAEIAGLKKIKTALIARMNIIQDLQQNRPLIVHLFDELNRVLPQGVHFTKLSMNGAIILLDGVAESNSNVSMLMRNIETDRWLMLPTLNEIKVEDKNKRKIKMFRLQFLLRKEQTGT